MTNPKIPKTMVKDKVKYYRLSTYTWLAGAKEYADNHDIGYKKLIRHDTYGSIDYYTVFSVKKHTKK